MTDISRHLTRRILQKVLKQFLSVVVGKSATCKRYRIGPGSYGTPEFTNLNKTSSLSTTIEGWLVLTFIKPLGDVNKSSSQSLIHLWSSSMFWWNPN